MATKHIFVYGTLRHGQRAHSMLDRAAVHVKTCTIKGASIYHLGGFPGLKLEEGGTVVGDLYEIPDTGRVELLQKLDMYEGYREEYPMDSLYLRQTIQVEGTEAWVYVFNHPVEGYNKIENGDWFSGSQSKA